MRINALLATLLVILVSPISPAWAGQNIRVAVAANFKPTLQRISAQFEAATGHSVVLSSASTGVLYAQIINGAPYQLFFAADTDSPARLAARAKDGPGTTPFCYAMGRLALVGGDSSLTQLADSQLSLAIANPVTAPYGRAAEEVIMRPEFRSGLGRKLVRGNNAAQAYQFWHSRAVDLALVPMALAQGKGATIPVDWHGSLEQHAIVLEPSPAVSAYLKWIRSDTVRTLINEAGYLPCS